MNYVLITISASAVVLMVVYFIAYNRGWNDGRSFEEKREKKDWGAEAFKLRDEILADQIKIDQLQKQIDNL